MSNPFSHAGRHVVVTGGASRVGAALLDLPAELGAPEVTVVDRNAPDGPHARFVEADLSDAAGVDVVTEAVKGPVDGREAHRVDHRAGDGFGDDGREVATALAFSGSDAASYVNGHDLVADGGFNAAMTTGQVDFSGLA